MQDDHNPFDHDIEQGLLHKRVLVGLTWLNSEDEELARRQLHGVIVKLDRRAGITLEVIGSGEQFTLPPDPAAFQVAPEGTYTLRDTGEVVENPDLIATWSIVPKDNLPPADLSFPTA